MKNTNKPNEEILKLEQDIQNAIETRNLCLRLEYEQEGEIGNAGYWWYWHIKEMIDELKKAKERLL